ncbi:hypothetical protein HYDPIDRAFT_109973 [Hydnomerulius pinastri MD-312]|nr:hypothetical protein HYDPIDRAFT_109973 [Hydnomerulius pinastri MD-312]
MPSRNDTEVFVPGQPQRQPVASAPHNGDMIIRVDPDTLRKADHDHNTDVIVYECKWGLQVNPCHVWIEGSAREIHAHLRKYHGVEGNTKDAILCRWLGCAQERKLGSMPRHIMTHLRVRFGCSNCTQQFAREDCIQAHRRDVQGCSEADTFIVPGPLARVIGRECTAEPL